MRHLDLYTQLDNLVSERIHNILGPHLDALERLSSFLGLRRGPGRPPGSRGGRRVATAQRRNGGRKAATRSRRSTENVSKFHEGQKVLYRQGRGEFEAKVIKTDAKANMLTIERASDGKRVVRPPSKVYSA